MMNTSTVLPKIAIIGAGSVGTTIAYSIILRSLHATIWLADKNTDLCHGQVKDLDDAAFHSSTQIKYADIKETGTCDIIIVTAGAKQRPGESRADLVDRNNEIMSSIISSMGTLNPRTIWMVVANPVELLTILAQKLTKLPPCQVIGTGTFLDTQRLRLSLARKLAINSNSIHCNVVGEHGDRQIVAWSNAIISGGLPLLSHPQMKTLSPDDLKTLEHEISRRAYDIIALKGSTHYGIGYCVSVLCDAVLSDSHTVYPIACYHPEYKTYLSFPTILARQGVVGPVPNILFNDEESQRLTDIAESIRNTPV